jgi:hypothetical protein
MVRNGRLDYPACPAVAAWFGYGKFSLLCGCGASPTSPRPSPSPVPSPSPPARSPSPVPSPAPANTAQICLLFNSTGHQVSSIVGPIIGGQTISYGTSTLTVNSPPGFLTLSLSVSGSFLVPRDAVTYQFYRTEADFRASIGAPGVCSRKPCGQLALRTGHIGWFQRQVTITYPLNALALNNCTTDETFLVVHLPLVSAWVRPDNNRGKDEGGI